MTETLHRGEIVSGSVTNVTSFGVFVDVGEGVEGLVHASETPRGQATLSDLTTGTPVRVQVLGIDEHRRRISLRLGGVQVAEPAWEATMDEALSEGVEVLA